MTASPDLRVIFRAAAGARRGFGHLLRCRALARALGVRPLLSLRGPRSTADVALKLGCDVVAGSVSRLMRGFRPDLVIVDDPIASHASRWITAARRGGAVVVSIHDLGLGSHDADLRIDGSVASVMPITRGRRAIGPAYAIVDPASVPSGISRPARRRVVVSLGGGPRARAACAIAHEIAKRAPDVEVRVFGGFVSPAPPRSLATRGPANVRWMGASANLRAELGPAAVAVVGGGVSLYEACALGVPAVGVPVVAAQRPTVAAFVARGAALGRPRSALVPRQVADDVLRLLEEEQLRRRISRTGRRLIDGRGAVRAAAQIQRLVRGR